MSFDLNLIERVMPKILESIYSISISGGKLTFEAISKKLDIPQIFLEEVLKLAFERGYVLEDKLTLTDKGKEYVLQYRQSFIHDKQIHKKYSLEYLKPSITLEHWKYGHGWSSEELDSLKTSLMKFDGSIEEVESLMNLRPGEKGEFVYAIGGYGMLKRLSDLGLTPGVKFEVISTGPFGGPFIIRVRGYDIILGRGIASKIYVKRIW